MCTQRIRRLKRDSKKQARHKRVQILSKTSNIHRHLPQMKLSNVKDVINISP